MGFDFYVGKRLQETQPNQNFRKHPNTFFYSYQGPKVVDVDDRGDFLIENIGIF